MTCSMAASDWKIEREASRATWNGYLIKWIERSIGRMYWVYGPGGRFMACGYGTDASSFIRICEDDAKTTPA